MKNLPKYSTAYPHLIDKNRIELACDYLTHESMKIFSNIDRNKIYDSIKRQAPTKVNNDDVTIRNFWNLFCSISFGWMLKELSYYVTSKNVEWEKKK